MSILLATTSRSGGIEKAEVFADPKVIMDRIEQARIKGFAMR